MNNEQSENHNLLTVNIIARNEAIQKKAIMSYD